MSKACFQGGIVGGLIGSTIACGGIGVANFIADTTNGDDQNIVRADRRAADMAAAALKAFADCQKTGPLYVKLDFTGNAGKVTGLPVNKTDKILVGLRDDVSVSVSRLSLGVCAQ